MGLGWKSLCGVILWTPLRGANNQSKFCWTEKRHINFCETWADKKSKWKLKLKADDTANVNIANVDVRKSMSMNIWDNWVKRKPPDAELINELVMWPKEMPDQRFLLQLTMAHYTTTPYISKHRKNCECCPGIQVLNCKNCNQCLNCHKSAGLF